MDTTRISSIITQPKKTSSIITGNNRFSKALLVIASCLIISLPAAASNTNTHETSATGTNTDINNNNSPYSVSLGLLKRDINQQTRSLLIQEIKATERPVQLSGKASAKTRTEMLSRTNTLTNTSTNTSGNTAAKQQKFAKSLPIENASQQPLTHSIFADFAIYGASSYLQEDYDGDGYYQTFSVTFDADIFSYTANQLGNVYALLYLSKNGGPWTHYYTTDDFMIEADSDVDEYEVITTFLAGYPTDTYDVLIDLYEVGYTDIVASYSADDSNALYALPIESANYDQPYVEVVEVIDVVEVKHGGSMALLLLLVLIIFMARLKNTSQLRL